MSLVSIAEKNSKLGLIPNISLLPIVSCVKGIVCAKWTECYAVKFVKMYKNVKAAWKKNTDLAKSNPDLYFSAIFDFLWRRKFSHFRWHVSGDILDQNYFDRMCILATDYPNTQFLAFTKRYTLDFSCRPDNLTIMFSIWPTLDLPKRPPGIKFAFLQDGTEKRLPDIVELLDYNLKLCHGNCDVCLFCWSPKSDVIMPKH
jgi:hypothetical protein